MKKLTRFTADAFIVPTKCNIAASKHNFQYVLPAVFSQSPLENIFGQARQRKGGGANFYIDICDVIAAANVHPHQLIKYYVVPDETMKTSRDLEHISILIINNTQSILESSDTLKHKIIYIGGFLMHKHVQPSKNEGKVYIQLFRRAR